MTREARPAATLLALDTSGPVGAVAVAREGAVVAGASLGRRMEHAAHLLPAVGRALEEAGVARVELEGVVVGAGPGSFTGVRVAAATAKGLARALAIPLWAVSSLAGAALAVAGTGVRYVLFDARGDRVYGACYHVGGDAVRTLVSPHAGEVSDVLASRVPRGALFVGDAAQRHRARIEGAGHTVAEDGPVDSPAVGLLRYLALEPDAPVADVATWEPTYLRASGAVPS